MLSLHPRHKSTYDAKFNFDEQMKRVEFFFLLTWRKSFMPSLLNGLFNATLSTTSYIIFESHACSLFQIWQKEFMRRLKKQYESKYLLYWFVIYILLLYLSFL